jgi:hypothetical protein
MLLVFEDLQLIDSETQALLDGLVDERWLGPIAAARETTVPNTSTPGAASRTSVRLGWTAFPPKLPNNC